MAGVVARLVSVPAGAVVVGRLVSRAARLRHRYAAHSERRNGCRRQGGEHRA
jgi:hypothetical protein